MQLPSFSANATILQPIREAMTKAIGIGEIGELLNALTDPGNHVNTQL